MFLRVLDPEKLGNGRCGVAGLGGRSLYVSEIGTRSVKSPSPKICHIEKETARRRLRLCLYL